MKIFFDITLLISTVWFFYVANIKVKNFPLYMDKAFEPYIELFNSEMSGRGHFVDLSKVKISFDNLDKQIATCYYGIEFLKIIKVDKFWWKQLTREEKEATIFHELGHCVLRRRLHTDSIYSNGCPLSLMHSSHTLKDCYFKNRSKYLDELFSEM